MRHCGRGAALAMVSGAACGLVIGCDGSTAIERGSGGGAGGGSEDGGSGGGAGGGAGGTPSAVCVDVSHVGALQKKDLQVIGSGFDAYEGLMIRIFATLGESAYGLGEAPIEGGAFDIFLPGVLGDYTGLGVHVDRVRDNACNPADEFIWQQATGPMSTWGPSYTTTASGGAIWAVTPGTLRMFEQAGNCNINGIFDLTIPIPCPARK
jgi:hypothetical protein